MSNLNIVYLFIVLACFSCKKEDVICYYGKCLDWSAYGSTATINNGAIWKAEFCTFRKRYDSPKYALSLDRGNKYHLHSEAIAFDFLPLIPGKINVIKKPRNEQIDSPYSMFWVGDDDVIFTCYDILEGSEFDNYLEITYISADTKEIAGNYHLHFAVSAFCPPNQNPNMPDTIYFRHGEFRAINTAMIE